ncbi:MAG: DUF1553 domain-containing protein [Planctomycetaceae bacterium]
MTQIERSIPRLRIAGRLSALLMLALSVSVAMGADGQQAGTLPVDFNTEIRPLLSNNCFFCHGPDADERQADLRLDTRAGAIADLGGHQAIAPGQVDASELIRRITSTDPDVVMPPAGKGKPLTPAQIGVLKRWIAEGAPYAEHWSYVKPTSPAVPETKHNSHANNEIDRFVLRRLETEELNPSPEADRQALIRRVTLDLTGLPPTLEEVDAFLADESPDAYESLVDRLLASPAYGEHMARMWLDLARYADSAGYADDPARTIWGYRDAVIRSFNRNQPFDQFTIEQLAGDLLPDATEEQRIATAFHRNTLTNNEGGTNDEEFRNVAVVDRVNTTLAVWMGTTMACAQCHTHKYDPISQHEYFQFFAILNQSADADRRDESPYVSVFTDEQRQQERDWKQELASLEQTLKTPTPELRTALVAWQQKYSRPIDWTVSIPTAASSTAETSDVATSTENAGLSVDADGVVSNPQRLPNDTYTVTLPAAEELRKITGLQIETLPTGNNFVITRVSAAIVPPGDASLPGRFVRVELPGKGQMLSLAEVQVVSGGNNIAINGTATQSSTDFGGPPNLAIDGNTNGDYKAAMSTTHTAVSDNPWWEVDLKSTQPLDSITLWNRTDNSLHTRLNNFKVQVLDADRKVVWEETVVEPPNPSREFALSGIRPLPFQQAVADFSQQSFSPEKVLAAKSSPDNGWAIAPQLNDAHRLTLTTAAPVEVPAGAFITVTIEQQSKHKDHTLDKFRLSLTTNPQAAEQSAFPADVVTLLSQSAEERGAEGEQRLLDYYLSVAPSLQPQRDRLNKVTQSLANFKPATTVPVLQELSPDKHRKTHVQLRGNYLDKGDEVQPGLPVAFGPTPTGPIDRLAMAQWIVSRDNPLTARVITNRMWEKMFGIGIVRTSEEFGSQGERPSHPELLDWLAVDFMEHGWDVKRLMKQLAMSATYRQSSRVSPELVANDPDNRLLARGPRFRLSAEMVRDQSLALAGLLSPKMYGPPVRPPQPSMGLNAAFGSSTDWQTSMGEDRYRRGIYVTWRRSNPYPSMAAFDAPNREVCTLKRDRTNTPLQAFVTLNDPVYVEAAQGLARRIQSQPGDVSAQLSWGFRLCLSREPSEIERNRLVQLYTESRAKLAENPAQSEKLATDPLGPVPDGVDPVDLAAWTVVCNVLLNLDETLMKR